MLFHDPALVFQCSLPWGWCLDGESSLFRIAFRPWDRLDERVIITALRVSVAPNASNAGWATAIGGETKFDADRSVRLAAGAARIFHPAVAAGRTIRRIVRRGTAFDIAVDHLYTG